MVHPKAKAASKKTLPTLSRDQALHFYRQMLKIRLFEEQVNQLYLGAKMPGLAHLYIGQEAVAVGVCAALRRDDYITSTHRGHGHCLAKGASVDKMFAELLGKEAGYCHGKGGSMHIADQDTGNLGANAIVGGSAGIATGAAMSAKMRGSDQVAVCFFGEGALGQGLLYEVMNMTSARTPHHFVGINADGQTSIIKTMGNPDRHIVLRGGGGKTNYEAEHVAKAEAAVSGEGIARPIMSVIVRCSDRFNQTNGVGDHPFFPAHRIQSLSALHLYVDPIGVDARGLGHFFLHRSKMRGEPRRLRNNDGINITHTIALRLELAHHVFQELEA